MIVVRNAGLSGLSGAGLSGALDSGFTIPGFGIRISIRQILLLLCNMQELDKSTCDLIRLNPSQACGALVAKGDKWLADKFDKILDTLISQTLSAVDCEADDWKDVVSGALSVGFSSKGGISIEIDWAQLVQSTICLLINKSVGLALSPVRNLLIKKLKESCESWSAPSGATTAPAPASPTAAPTPTTTSSTSISRTTCRPDEDPGFDICCTYVGLHKKCQKVAKATATNSRPVIQTPPAVYSVPTAPQTKTGGTVLVWGGVGVVLLGATWFALSRR